MAIVQRTLPPAFAVPRRAGFPVGSMEANAQMEANGCSNSKRANKWIDLANCFRESK